MNVISSCYQLKQLLPVAMILHWRERLVLQIFFQRAAVSGERFIVELAVTQSQMKQRIRKKEWWFVLLLHEGAVTQSKRGWQPFAAERRRCSAAAAAAEEWMVFRWITVPAAVHRLTTSQCQQPIARDDWPPKRYVTH